MVWTGHDEYKQQTGQKIKTINEKQKPPKSLKSRLITLISQQM